MHALVDSQSIIITEGDSAVVIASSDPTYPAVRRYVVDDRGSDFAAVRQIMDGIRTPLSTAVTDAEAAVDGDSCEATPYRIQHGDPVSEVVLATAMRIAREDGDLSSLAKFFKRLERNPSAASRSQLFSWLKAGGFTITREGFIVGYKSVARDGLSSHGGVEPVTVRHQDGRTETVTGRIPYPVGATVSMPRELVDDDRDSACSVGIHVGTFTYAETFSHEMLVVLVDPAHVVSVPRDAGAQKMRVSELLVAAKCDGEQIGEAVIDTIRNVPDPAALEEYLGREENRRSTRQFAIPLDILDDEDEDEEYGDGDRNEGDEDYDEDDQYGFPSGY
jgi:hypothetical protein